ncbi:MAG TPA: hypothetical protein GXX42_05420, partial [Petrimonas sp.]|uniref:hypothetical protein n=1 Tax=Petrimonas sp. TaxID=2023866 RepID=UPI001755BE6B|nr:hypothetical protein [Petrimonas sp.]
MKVLKKLLSLNCCLFLGLSLLYGQSLKSIQFDKENHLMVQAVEPGILLPKGLPLVSYRINETEYSTAYASKIMDISFSAQPFEYGIKGVIRFKNNSTDTINLHNVVPLGRDEGHVYITGKGSHGLSRSYLFRPGYQPLNVILPDNAWELGFTCVETEGKDNMVALVRRNNKSLEDGKLRRFETTLYPGGIVEYSFWLDKYQGDWQEGLKLMFQDRLLYDVPVGTFNNTLFEREDLKWIRNCYAVNLMMTWDKRFYD